MNHLLTFIFLIFIFYFYWLIGEFVADCFAIKIKNSTAYVIYGFISVFFKFIYKGRNIFIFSP